MNTKQVIKQLMSGYHLNDIELKEAEEVLKGLIKEIEKRRVDQEYIGNRPGMVNVGDEDSPKWVNLSETKEE